MSGQEPAGFPVELVYVGRRRASRGSIAYAYLRADAVTDDFGLGDRELLWAKPLTSGARPGQVFACQEAEAAGSGRVYSSGPRAPRYVRQLDDDAGLLVVWNAKDAEAATIQATASANRKAPDAFQELLDEIRHQVQAGKLSRAQRRALALQVLEVLS